MIGTTNSNNFMPRPDWTQNDEGALDYVKGRTHYEEDPIITVIVEANSFTIDSDGGTYSWWDAGRFKDGERYIVILNGVEYECVAWYYNGECCIGNGSIYGDVTQGNGEPFCIKTYSISSMTLYVATAGTYTVTIASKEIPVVKLPAKYLLNSNIENGNADGSVQTIFSSATGDYSHAEGYNTTASNRYTHAEGFETNASAQYSHAEGRNTTASGEYSHVEGIQGTASGSSSHAEGMETTASGSSSHAEGTYSKATGNYSHAEGFSSTASGYYSHAEGNKTIAASSTQHVQGKYNVEDANGTYAHIVGNGNVDTTARSNAHTLDWEGNAWFAGDVYVGSTSGTNKDEGSVKLQKAITGTPGQFVVIGDDGLVTTKTVPNAEEVGF